MNFLSKFFSSEEKYVGLCSLKRANRPVQYTRKVKYTTEYFQTNTSRNIYLSIKSKCREKLCRTKLFAKNQKVLYNYCR